MSCTIENRCGWMGRVVLACSLAGVTGCALPDVSPFTASTVELRGAVSSTGDAVVAELKRIDQTQLTNEDKARLNDAITQLLVAWQERVNLFDSLTAYAQSLQAIVDAGQTGEQAATALAGQVQQLAEAAGIVAPGAGAVGQVVTESAAFVYGQISKALSAKALSKSLDAAQPSIVRIMDVMAGKVADGNDPDSNTPDLAKMSDLILVATEFQRSLVKRSLAAELGYRDELLKAREKLYSQAKTALGNNTSPSALAITNDLKAVDELLAKTDSWHTPHEVALANIDRREREALTLVDETHAALQSWAAAHARLAAAVKEKKTANIQELASAVVRIRALVQKIREL